MWNLFIPPLVKIIHNFTPCYSKNNLRIEIPITIGTHGVRADDDPADEPDLRPLYTRAANQSGGGAEPVGVSALRRDISADDEDDIGEIDISLFEGAGGGQL